MYGEVLFYDEGQSILFIIRTKFLMNLIL